MRLGRVEVTGGFLLLTAWLNYLDRQGVVPLALLACALHELGHWAALRALGARVRRVRLTAVGAEMGVSCWPLWPGRGSTWRWPWPSARCREAGCLPD